MSKLTRRVLIVALLCLVALGAVVGKGPPTATSATLRENWMVSKESWAETSCVTRITSTCVPDWVDGHMKLGWPRSS